MYEANSANPILRKEICRVPVLLIFSIAHTRQDANLPVVNTNTTNNTRLKRRDLVFFRSNFFSKIFQKISKNFKIIFSDINHDQSQICYLVCYSRKGPTHTKHEIPVTHLLTRTCFIYCFCEAHSVDIILRIKFCIANFAKQILQSEYYEANSHN